ncbi:hypothetical protein [Acetobacter thailandicus]|uniref:hypothetical protein n=1 Tax=Acetobacter thailandicus TaxID=1502842 RepID=UPI0031FEEE6D
MSSSRLARITARDCSSRPELTRWLFILPAGPAAAAFFLPVPAAALVLVFFAGVTGGCSPFGASEGG